MDDYGEYNGNTVHDMWTDYTYGEWCGGSSGGYSSRLAHYRVPGRKLSIKEQIARLKNKTGSCLNSIRQNEKLIADIDNLLKNQRLSEGRKESLIRSRKRYEARNDRLSAKVADFKVEVASLEHELKLRIRLCWTICIVAAVVITVAALTECV